MNHALWIAKTGLEAQQTRLAVQSNNLANANTTGFKRARAVFEDLVYQNIRQVGAQSSESTLLPSGLSLGTGVRTVATEKLFSQGNLVQTGNALDVAIQGRGFLQILLPDGAQAYTRDGSLQIDAEGALVLSNREGVKALERAGLVEKDAAGLRPVYRLAPQAMAAPRNWLDRFARFWEGALDRLEDYIAEMDAAAEEDADAAPDDPASPPSDAAQDRPGPRAKKGPKP